MFSRRRSNPLRQAAVRMLYHTTGGMVGGTMFGTKMVLLHFVVHDEPSGAFLPYFENEGKRIVVAMQADTDNEGDWWYQLRNGATATAEIDGTDLGAVRGEEIVGAERARAWAKILEQSPVYEEMEAAALKPFPLIALVPAS